MLFKVKDRSYKTGFFIDWLLPNNMVPFSINNDFQSLKILMFNLKKKKNVNRKNKKTIREEESYRQAVRAELEKGFSKKKKFFLFFNTPFGISVVTALIFSCGSWGVNTFMEKRKSKAHDFDKVSSLKQEIGLRSKAFNCLSEPFDQGNINELRGLIYGYSGAICKYNVYKEFNERDIRSLILEAKSLIPVFFG